MSRLTKATILRLATLALTLAVLIGCVGAKSPAKPIYYYTLGDETNGISFDTALPHVVRVERFSATPPFDSQHIIYAEKGLYRNAYTHFKWIAPPGELMAFSLAHGLRQSGAFRAVLPPDASTPATHSVHGWIETFLEEDTTEPARAALSLNISLIDVRLADPVARILFQKRYTATAPCDERTPAALSRAMSVAAATVNKQIILDVRACLAEKQEP